VSVLSVTVQMLMLLLLSFLSLDHSSVSEGVLSGRSSLEHSLVLYQATSTVLVCFTLSSSSIVTVRVPGEMDGMQIGGMLLLLLLLLLLNGAPLLS
jgi:hypothetical protein